MNLMADWRWQKILWIWSWVRQKWCNQKNRMNIGWHEKNRASDTIRSIPTYTVVVMKTHHLDLPSGTYSKIHSWLIAPSAHQFSWAHLFLEAFPSSKQSGVLEPGHLCSTLSSFNSLCCGEPYQPDVFSQLDCSLSFFLLSLSLFLFFFHRCQNCIVVWRLSPSPPPSPFIIHRHFPQ